jgi:hypothetical protein
VNRVDTYRLLSARLNELRGKGYDLLLSRVGQATVSEIIQVNNEDVVVDIAVFWADKKRRTLRVCGTAFGPSTWMMERIDESFVIGPSQAAKG